MSDHYDNYYTSDESNADFFNRQKYEKIKRVMDHFGISEKEAKKKMEDFRILKYATN